MANNSYIQPVIGDSWNWNAGANTPGFQSNVPSSQDVLNQWANIADVIKYDPNASSVPTQGTTIGSWNDNAQQRPKWWNQGEAGPPGSPDFVRNPRSEQDWQNRYNWLQQNQSTAYTANAPINAWYQRDDPTANTYLNALASGQIPSYNGMDQAGAQRQLLSWEAERQGGQLEPGSPASPAGRYHLPDGKIIDVATGKAIGFDPGSSGFKAQQQAVQQPQGAYSGTPRAVAGTSTVAPPAQNYMTGQAPAAPPSYASTQGQAWSSNPTAANLAALWKSRGMSDAQIAQMMAQSGIDPKTGQPLTPAQQQMNNYQANQQAAIAQKGIIPWLTGR